MTNPVPASQTPSTEVQLVQTQLQLVSVQQELLKAQSQILLYQGRDLNLSLADMMAKKQVEAAEAQKLADAATNAVEEVK